MLSRSAFQEWLTENTGSELGLSQWIAYDQDGVDAHGALTLDNGPIHADPVWAAENTAFGGSIVQGSLLISSLTRLAREMAWPEGDLAYRLNYGFDRVRIIRPVKTGQKFRARFVLKQVAPKGESGLLITVEVALETEDGAAPDAPPALLAEWLFYFQFNT